MLHFHPLLTGNCDSVEYIFIMTVINAWKIDGIIDRVLENVNDF